MIRTTVFLLILCGMAIARPAIAQISENDFTELKQLVSDQMAKGAVNTRLPMFGEPLNPDGYLYWSFGGGLEEGSKVHAVLALATLELVRDGKGGLHEEMGRDYWLAYVPSIEAVIKEEIAYRQSVQRPDTRVINRFQRRVFNIYQEAFDRYARTKGLRAKWVEYDEVMGKLGAAAAPWFIDTRIRSQTGRGSIRWLTAFEYLVTSTAGIPPAWNSYRQGSEVNVGVEATYAYIVDRPGASGEVRFHTVNVEEQDTGIILID